MIHGFLEKTKEKVEVYSKDETYSKTQICSNASGMPIVLFDGQIELWIFKNVALGGVAANNHEFINIDAPSNFFNGINASDDANDYFSVFVTPRPETTPEYNVDVKFMRYFHNNYQASEPWKGFSVMLINNGVSAVSIRADILFIKQVH